MGTAETCLIVRSFGFSVARPGSGEAAEKRSKESHGGAGESGDGWRAAGLVGDATLFMSTLTERTDDGCDSGKRGRRPRERGARKRMVEGSIHVPSFTLHSVPRRDIAPCPRPSPAMASSEYAYYQPEPPVYYPSTAAVDIGSTGSTAWRCKRRRILRCRGDNDPKARRNLYRWAKW